MSGFLQRLVDAAELPPMALPVLRSASPIFSYDQRLGLPSFEGIAGFDWDAASPPVDLPAPDALLLHEVAPPAQPARDPFPDAGHDREKAEPAPRNVPPPLAEPPARPAGMPPSVVPAMAREAPPVAQEPPRAAAIPFETPVAPPASLRMEAERPAGAEPTPPRVVVDPAARPEPPRPRQAAPAPAPAPVLRRHVPAREAPARAERAMLVDVARARDAAPERSDTEPPRVGELRPALRLPAMIDAPPELPPPRSETRPAPVRVVEKVKAEAPPPPPPAPAPPTKPLTAASASVIGSLEGMRRQNRIFALRQL